MSDGPTVSLRDLGRAADLPTPSLESGLGMSRVAVEHRGAYVLWGPHGEREAAVTPALRDAVEDQRDFPAVGDWVVHTLEPLHDQRVLITAVETRTSQIVRRAPGPEPVPQVVAANVDVLGVVTTAEEDFNERRLERYLVTALGSGARPLLIINKVDLFDGPRPSMGVLAADVEVIETSASTGAGVDHLAALAAEGRTLAFTGSSGVGKSSLVNRLMGGDVLATGEVRSDGRGRHTTIRRELLQLPTGGVVIDTPGLREVQLWDDGGLEIAFPEIAEAAQSCRFGDCVHAGEPGCAVAEGIEAGELVTARVDAYQDLAAELAELAEELEEHERVTRRRRDARARPNRANAKRRFNDQ